MSVLVEQSAWVLPRVFSGGKSIGENEKYEKVKTIGKGSFGMAILCKHAARGHVVVKKVEVRKEKILKNVVQEVMVMRKLTHPNIIGFYDVWQSSNAVYIALEYATGGDLEKVRNYYITKQICISETHLRSIVWQVCSALEYLHSRNVVHRDIKSANIFLTAAGVVKLGDFGLSKVLDTDGMCKSQVGTPYYMSPEVVQGKKYKSSCDMWAVGIVIYELMYFAFPFMSSNLKELQHLILTAEVDFLPPHTEVLYSEKLITITESCLTRDPVTRIAAHDVLESLGSQKVTKICIGVGGADKKVKRKRATKSPKTGGTLTLLEKQEAYGRYLIVQEAFQIHAQWRVMCN